MIEEPEITPDDTSPRKAISVDEKLRAEEPPISADDTSPRKVRTLDERIAAEEPPVSVDDTSPSAISRPPRKTSRRAQRVIGFVLLLGSLALTLLAAFIWMNEEDEKTPRPVEEMTPTAAAVLSTATVMLTPTDKPTEMPTVMAEMPSTLPTAQFAFPTAAADEIAAALLTPVAGKPVAGAVGRHSEPFTIRSAESRASVTLYTVQEGDTLESVAGKFGLNDYWTLIWSNSRNKVSPLRPGAQINIMPEDGVYYEVTDNITITQLAEKYQVTPYDIIDSEYNPDLFGATPETLLVAGMWVVIPGGKGEQINLLAANPNSGSGGSGGGGAVSGPYNLWGCSSNITGGTNPVQRPLQYYTWMRGLIPGAHDGVDLSADEGDPVYAAGSGTVAFAGWNDYGFGNVVVIAHGSVFSIYGHLHDYAVRCGGYVDAGQVIGSVGNTGNSTGAHLHFELRDANWNLVNPQSYVGF